MRGDELDDFRIETERKLIAENKRLSDQLAAMSAPTPPQDDYKAIERCAQELHNYWQQLDGIPKVLRPRSGGSHPRDEGQTMTPIQARIMSAILNNAKVTLFSSQSMALDRFELTREQIQAASAAVEPLINELTDKFAKRASRLVAAAEARREAAAKALKASEYDCSDWDMDILREVAGIAITAAAEVEDKLVVSSGTLTVDGPIPANEKFADEIAAETKVQFPHGTLLVNTTLEDCARIADEYNAWPAREIAATIRSKKVV